MDASRYKSWLDQAVAVPAIGLRFRQNYRYVLSYPATVLRAVVDELKVGERHLFQQRNAYEFFIDLRDGFTFLVNQDRIIVRFQYAIEERKEPGQLPYYDPVTAKPYSSLLSDLVDRSTVVVNALASLHDVEARWFGIVSSVSLDKQKLPHGVSAYLESLGRPWNKTPIESESRVTVNLYDCTEHYDRCHHQLAFREEERPDDLMLTLDWQRVQKNDRPINSDQVKSTLANWASDGVAYFERFGQGNFT